MKKLAALAIAAAPALGLAQDSGALRLRMEKADEYRLPASARRLPEISPRLADKPYAAEIHQAAHAAGVDPALVHALIYIESRYDAGARSDKGALGLMQVLPETGARYGVADLLSPEHNLRAGTQYLRDLLKQFKGDVSLALAAYNAGENAVVRHEKIPPYKETQLYVPAVIGVWWQLREPRSRSTEYAPGTRLNMKSEPASR